MKSPNSPPQAFCNRQRILFSNGSWWLLDSERKQTLRLDARIHQCGWSVTQLCRDLGIGKHSYTYDTFGNIDSWKREAPLANPTGLTRQFDSKVFYDRSDQVSSVIHTPLAGSSVVESATLRL